MRGIDVEIHAIFMRHGDKKKNGKISQTGKKDSQIFGKYLTGNVIKIYSSPIQRALDTGKYILKGFLFKKKITRTRKQLRLINMSEGFINEITRREEKEKLSGLDWYLNFDKERPDEETISPYEIAESFGYLLFGYYKMANRLFSGSRVNLVNVTHSCEPELLLKEVMIKEKSTGFNSFSEIGGYLNTTESMDFVIRINGSGVKTIRLYFREKEYGVDIDKLEKMYWEYKLI